jgi:hypothetical protein
VDDIIATLANFSVESASTSSRPPSMEMDNRVMAFERYTLLCSPRHIGVLIFSRRLTEIKMSVTRQSATKQDLLHRLMEAEKIAKDLSSVWDDFQRAYNRLIVSFTSISVNRLIILTVCTDDDAPEHGE